MLYSYPIKKIQAFLNINAHACDSILLQLAWITNCKTAIELVSTKPATYLEALQMQFRQNGHQADKKIYF